MTFPGRNKGSASICMRRGNLNMRGKRWWALRNRCNGTLHLFDARVNRELHRNQISLNFLVEAFPCCFGRPVRIRRAPTTKGLAHKKARRPERQKCGQTRSLQESSSVHHAVNPPCHGPQKAPTKLLIFCHSERITSNSEIHPDGHHAPGPPISRDPTGIFCFLKLSIPRQPSSRYSHWIVQVAPAIWFLPTVMEGRL